MIDTILDAIEYALEIDGDPQDAETLAEQLDSMRLWRASRADVREALDEDMAKWGAESQFVKLADGSYGLKSWETK